MTATSLSTEPKPPAAATRPVRRSRRPPRDKRRNWVLTVMIWMTVLYFLVPLVWLVLSATKDNAGLFSSFGLWFGDSFQLFHNIEALFRFQDGIFVRWLANTIAYALIGSIGAALLATMCGYALAKYAFRGAGAVFTIILGSIMVPLTALAIPTYLLFAAGNLTDTPFAVVLPSLVSPFGVYLMRVYAADAVDDSLLEAARIDGAGEFRIF
ncbi:carbohydrate ABC transporter permease [Actinomadura fibrosa]|uniref:Carbohydrate ABC transporter permease n=1 Tax=Actinomadura fibrosa TaxID=111802 RepID=A0ABW2XHJ9_9ACTN|nr:carbohydrate ABC transporter permease [Actinomadura fibrosa]